MRPSDMPKQGPLSGAVQLGRLIELRRDVAKPGQVQQHVGPADGGPDAHDHDGWLGPGDREQPFGGRGLQAKGVKERVQHVVQRTKLGVEYGLPQDEQRHTRGDRRQVEHGPKQHHAPEPLVENDSQEERTGNADGDTQHQIERVAKEAPEAFVRKQVGEVAEPDELQGCILGHLPVGEGHDQAEKHGQSHEGEEPQEVGGQEGQRHRPIVLPS